MKFNIAIEKFLKSVLIFKSYGTYKFYVSHLRYLDSYFNSYDIDYITYDLLMDFILDQKKHNVSNNTINKTIVLTGMRKSEGGQRASINCIITDKENNLVKFHPLLVVNDEFENWFIKQFNIELCILYHSPYNFNRTGCKGCPFSLDLQIQLDVMKKLLPNEYKQCELIWKPVYDEYRRINYRLRG